MGGCCSKDPDSQTSWSPSETKNASTTSTIVAQPTNDNTSAGVFTSTLVVPAETDGMSSETTTTTIIKTTKVTETVTTSEE